MKWYILHHAMYNPNNGSSAKVVFDCAAVFHNKSLNACLIQGPDILISLISVLCQFRALMGDIEKMFYRFKVKKEHRDYWRLLWWKDSDMTLLSIDCRIIIRIFGAVSSPCCANFALKRLANDNKDVVVPPPGDFDMNDLYSRKRWRRVQIMANNFWQQWKKEFVLLLQKRPKWQKAQRNVKIGNVVLLREDDLPRNRWKLGRVVEVISSIDDHVRRVKLIIGDSYLSKDGKRYKDLHILERPIHKLVIIFEHDEYFIVSI